MLPMRSLETFKYNFVKNIYEYQRHYLARHIAEPAHTFIHTVNVTRKVS